MDLKEYISGLNLHLTKSPIDKLEKALIGISYNEDGKIMTIINFFVERKRKVRVIDNQGNVYIRPLADYKDCEIIKLPKYTIEKEVSNN
ncbi:MAG: hypothetical protein ABH811_02590 [archaeon]